MRVPPSGPIVEGLNDNDSIFWDAARKVWVVKPGTSGGGAFPSPPAGDDGFLPRAGTGPTEGELEYFGGAAAQIVVWSTTNNRWEAGAVPTGVTIASFAAVAPTRFAVGAVDANPQFTLSYTGATPDSVSWLDNAGNPSQPLISPFTAFTSPFTYTRTTIGGTYAATVTALLSGFSPVQRSVTFATFCAPVYYGASSSAGPYDSAFLLGLSTSTLATSKSDAASSPSILTMNTTGTSGTRDFWGVPSSFAATGLFDVVNGFGVGASIVNTFNHVVNGVTISYDVWKSTNELLGLLVSRFT